MTKLVRRELRGLGIVAIGGQIRRISDGLFVVASQSGLENHEIRWRDARWSCDCPDFLKRHSPCKHVAALHWALKLPLMLVANSPVVGGRPAKDDGHTPPALSYEGRAVPVSRVAGHYQSVLAQIGDPNEIYPPPLPRPKQSRTRSGWVD